jgi:hypothetical protein
VTLQLAIRREGQQEQEPMLLSIRKTLCGSHTSLAVQQGSGAPWRSSTQVRRGWLAAGDSAAAALPAPLQHRCPLPLPSRRLLQAELCALLRPFGIQTEVVDRYIVTQSRSAVAVEDPVALVRHLEALIGTADYEELLQVMRLVVAPASASAADTAHAADAADAANAAAHAADAADAADVQQQLAQQQQQRLARMWLLPGHHQLQLGLSTAPSPRPLPAGQGAGGDRPGPEGG